MGCRVMSGTEPRIYRASSLGYSLCHLVCGELGYEAIAPPDYMQAIFDEGHRLEPIIIEGLNNENWSVTDEQKEVELDVIPGVAKVVGHIDGICVPDFALGGSVLEVKTMSHKNFLDWETNGWESRSTLIEKYKWQASAYMLATGLPHTMVCWDKQEKDWDSRFITEPFYSISDIALKISQAEEHIRNNDIPSNCTDFPCPYFYLHENKDAIPEEKADGELDTLMIAWLEADRKKKIYEGEAKALREMIVEFAGEKISGRIKGSQGVTVTTTWVDEAEWTTKRKAGWVTKVSAPRKRKVEDV